MGLRRSAKRIHRDQRGAQLVEFAILFPVLLVIILGIIEFGRLGYAFTEVWTSAREGARYATTVGDTGGVVGLPNFVDCDGILAAARSKALTRTLDLDPSDGVTIEYRDPGGVLLADCDGNDNLPSETGNIDAGTLIEVTVRADFNAAVPFVGALLDGAPLDSSQIRSLHLGVVGGP